MSIEIDSSFEEPDVDALDVAPDDGWNALYVDGKWVPAGDRDAIAVENPRRGRR